MTIERRLTRLERRRRRVATVLEVWMQDDAAPGCYVGPGGRTATRAALEAEGQMTSVFRLIVDVVPDRA